MALKFVKFQKLKFEYIYYVFMRKWRWVYTS